MQLLVLLLEILDFLLKLPGFLPFLLINEQTVCAEHDVKTEKTHQQTHRDCCQPVPGSEYSGAQLFPNLIQKAHEVRSSGDSPLRALTSQ